MPDWLDSDALQNVAIGLVAVLVLVAIFVMRTVQKTTTRLLMIGILAVSALGLVVYRDTLNDCAAQCSCELFGRDVDVPGCSRTFPGD